MHPIQQGARRASPSFSLAVTVQQQSSTTVLAVEPAPALTFRHILSLKREVVDMIKKAAIMGLLAAALAGIVCAQEGKVPKGIPHLDHVFVIMMENHGYKQIIGNPDTPFANAYANSANTATNYFAVAHPSWTNYLEVVGASNFRVHIDDHPDSP